METKSFFYEEGLTSTSANHYANLAKEMTRKIHGRLESVRFFDTDMSIIGDGKKTLASRGMEADELQAIKKNLQDIADCNSLIAFFREAIKEKGRLADEAARWVDEEGRAELERLIAEHNAVKPKRGAYLTPDDVIKSWSVGEQEKYLSLEAEAAVYGKFIHEDGSLSKARTELTKAINNPTAVKEAGRDTILYSFVPTVSQKDVDDLFFELQAHYREVQAELNGMKKRINDAIQEHDLQVDNLYRTELTQWNNAHKILERRYEVLNADEDVERKKRSREVQKLKIAVPNRLRGIFHDLQQLG